VEGGGFGIETRDPAMLRILEHAKRVAGTRYPVLLEGETGTGKELFARGIHAASGRRGRFVPVNCGAIPASLFEAELFGARRGAYTGQTEERKGLLRVANEGTLFLDEVAEMPHEIQAKLLRVLQDGEVRSLGATDTEKIDVRIISASHKDMQELVRQNAFRADLYYRISVTCIRIPPLRERPEDIDLLFMLAMREAIQETGGTRPEYDEEVIHAFRRHAWPGNVRELKHVVASAMVNANGGPLHLSHFPNLAHGSRDGLPNIESLSRSVTNLPFFDALADFERRYIETLLNQTEFNISQAAKVSGLSRATVRNKARQYKLMPSTAADEDEPKPRRRVRMPPA
jgi:transcriptional regulator with PAS, ATPase and Fis domain